MLGVCGLVALPQSVCTGQTQNEAAVLVGQGAFLRGAGSYNLNTAKADSINVDTVIRWKQDLRKISAERRELQARNEAGKKLRIEEVQERLLLREQQLRTNPTTADIQNGQALNALLDDLTDPDISSADWYTKVVPLPKDLSVKDLIFRFTPSSASPNASKALSRGVIALSRLDVEGKKWPTVMKERGLDKERAAYEVAYVRLREQLIDDKFDRKALVELDRSLDALKAKAETVVLKDRGFRDEALHFVEDLKDATRMFDAATVDYAREILVDTKEHDATTVAELVGFMLKYRLQFASAERSATGRVLYGQIYEVLQQQAKLFGIKPVEAKADAGLTPQLDVDKFVQQYAQACDRADKNLHEAFDKQIELVRKLPRLKADERQSQIEIIRVEKSTFEKHGTIPFSPVMRDDAIKYLKALAEADFQASKIYDKTIDYLTKKKDDAAAAEKVAEKKKVLAPKVVGKWQLTGINVKNNDIWIMYSNGTFQFAKSSWALDKTRMITNHPNSAAPGGAFVNTCTFEKNGQEFQIQNQTGAQFKATRIDPK